MDMTKTDKNLSRIAYQQFLDEIVHLVQNHRTKAVQAVQSFSNQLYWNIGELILKKQEEFGWGKSVVEQLSKDLNHQLGDAISWSPRNLWFMRQLVNEYSIVNQPGSDLKFLNQPGSDSSIVMQAASEIEKVKQLISEVPWKHNILIIQKVKDLNARIFYLQTTIKNRYSRAVLLHQIEANAYENYLLHPKQTNFNSALPEHLLEQTEESIKSIYSLDFLDINKPITERHLESSMVEKIKRLMMELGYGFCFIANQYRLELGNKEYFVDLLFYHRILKCLVAVELKVTEFEPEFVGKLDFYLQLIDEQLKQPDDKPSIGILLVPHKDRLEVEYALRIACKPIGVAKYTLSKNLPIEFSGKLPSSDDFNQLIDLDRSDAEEKKNSI
jgi:predicted nuclease of restriction endonuclease-like (RecB) superfamily